MKLSLFCMPTVPASSPAERERLRPIGRNPERYHAMIEEMRALAKACDQLGVHSISTTEHHFHTEGFESNPNPVLLMADLAARTERLIVVPMSIVVTAENPIRVAENIAMLDILAKGRVCIALARGYQKRWVQILGQGVGLTAAAVSTAEDDANNQRIYEEFEDIIFKALTHDAFDYDGKYFKVPYPYKDGIAGWPALPFSRRFGADGEFDDDGIVRRIGTVPGPYQKPYPEIWRTSSGSLATVAASARKGYVQFLFVPLPNDFRDNCLLYQAEAAKAGFSRRLGEKMGAVRTITVGRTDAEAWDISLKTTGECWHNYFNLFGFGEAFRYPHEDKATYPAPLKFDSLEAAQKRFAETGLSIQGTPDKVKRQLEDLHRCFADGELEYLCWMFNHQGMIPINQQLDQLDTFVNKVWKPMFG